MTARPRHGRGTVRASRRHRADRLPSPRSYPRSRDEHARAGPARSSRTKASTKPRNPRPSRSPRPLDGVRSRTPTHRRAPATPARASTSSISSASVPVGPATERGARLVVARPRPADRRDLVLGDVRAGSTRSAAARPRSSRRQRIEPRTAARCAHGVAAQPATFADATSSASSLTSVAHTSTSGSSASSASAIAPEPVPRSATPCLGRPVDEAEPPSDATQADAHRLVERDLDDHSVSGRGISTRGSTRRSSPRNDHAPSTYCNGSPRRAARPCRRSRDAARARRQSRPRCRATRRRA